MKIYIDLDETTVSDLETVRKYMRAQSRAEAHRRILIAGIREYLEALKEEDATEELKEIA